MVIISVVLVMAVASLCIIVPCYNESKRLELNRFLEFSKKHRAISICFANDGSTDNTAEVLQKFCTENPDRFIFINFQQNSGKAETIRKAFLECSAFNTFSFLGYLDADLSAPPEEMVRMFEVAQAAEDTGLVMGTRLRRMGAQVTRSAARHYLGRIFATLASMSLKLPVYDTQCGAKIIRTTLVPYLFKDPFISKWFFDIELLKRLLVSPGFVLSLNSIVEVPLNKWNAVDGSKVKLKDFLIAPLELWRIHRHYPAPDLDYDKIIE
jgi:glycosyltransferase involved in cell wall biosynthesis